MWWTIGAIAGAVLGAFVLLMLVLHLLGRRLPETHQVTRTIRLKARPEGVWELISDVVEYPLWAPGVTKVIKLEPINGETAFRQHMGRNSFVLRQTKHQKPTGEGEPGAGIIERTIADDRGPFSGTWTYRVTREIAGTTKLSLTEKGTIRRAVPRAVLHYLMGEDAYLKKHLRAIAAKFGEDAKVE